MRNFAKILIASAVLLALFALGRGLYYSPNGDSGLSLASLALKPETATATTATTALTTTAPATTEPRSPARLLIPKLNINSAVQHVGVTKSGNMAAPNNFTDVSWYKFGTLPGAKGSAVMAGHQDNAISLDGIFKHLEDLKVGDDVYVEGTDGKRLHFQVVEMQVYPYDSAPLERIFHASDDNYLVLITCAGKWLQSAKTNDHRLVVYTKLVK